MAISLEAEDGLPVGEGRGVDDSNAVEAIEQLEATLRMTSICGLGQVALGPVASVVGLQRGATAARSHPRPRP